MLAIFWCAYVAVSCRGFGSKILKQSGWKEGQGLGKRGSGMALALGKPSSQSSVADPDHFDSDLTFHFDAALDPDSSV